MDVKKQNGNYLVTLYPLPPQASSKTEADIATDATAAYWDTLTSVNSNQKRHKVVSGLYAAGISEMRSLLHTADEESKDLAVCLDRTQILWLGQALNYFAASQRRGNPGLDELTMARAAHNMAAVIEEHVV